MTVKHPSPPSDRWFGDGTAFGRALATHFGLRQVLDVKVNVGRNEVFGATITLALTPDDVQAIGRLMAEPTPPTL